MADLPDASYWEASLGSNFWANLADDDSYDISRQKNNNNKKPVIKLSPKKTIVHVLSENANMNKTKLLHNEHKKIPENTKRSGYSKSSGSTKKVFNKSPKNNYSYEKQYNKKSPKNNYSYEKQYNKKSPTNNYNSSHNEHRRNKSTYLDNESFQKFDSLLHSKSDISFEEKHKVEIVTNDPSKSVKKLSQTLSSDRTVNQENNTRNFRNGKKDLTIDNRKRIRITCHDLIVKVINNEFIHATTNNQTHVIMIKNGYFNATQMCNLHKFNYFQELEQTEEFNRLVGEVSAIMALERNELIINVTNQKNKRNNGIYVHEELVIDLALMLNVRIKSIVKIIMKDKQIIDILKQYGTPVVSKKKKQVENLCVESQLKELPLEELPLEELPLEELPLEELPIEELPIEELPLEESLANEQVECSKQNLIESVMLKLSKQKEIINGAMTLIKQCENTIIQLHKELDEALHDVESLIH